MHFLKLAGDVLIPPIIASEFQTNTSKQKLPKWIEIHPLNQSARDQSSEWTGKEIIDSGEADAIGLALQVKCDWFLTDDAQARQYAELLGLEVHGSIGLLLWAVAVEHIKSRKQAKRLLDGLIHSSLWLSDQVIREATKAIDELLPE